MTLAGRSSMWRRECGIGSRNCLAGGCCLCKRRRMSSRVDASEAAVSPTKEARSPFSESKASFDSQPGPGLTGGATGTTGLGD